MLILQGLDAGIDIKDFFIKGLLCSFEEEIPTQNFNIYNLIEEILQNVFFHQSINKLFSEENKFPKHYLKLEWWQGPPHINNVKQYELFCPLRSFSQENKESLFIWFV